MKRLNIRKVKPGQFPHAEDWNDLADCINQAKGRNGIRLRAYDTGLEASGGGGGLSWCGVVVQKGSHYYDDDVAAERDKFGGQIDNPTMGPKTVLIWFVDDSTPPYYTEGPIPSSMPANMEAEYVANLASAIHVH